MPLRYSDEDDLDEGPPGPPPIRSVTQAVSYTEGATPAGIGKKRMSGGRGSRGGKIRMPTGRGRGRPNGSYGAKKRARLAAAATTIHASSAPPHLSGQTASDGASGFESGDSHHDPCHIDEDEDEQHEEEDRDGENIYEGEEDDSLYRGTCPKHIRIWAKNLVDLPMEEGGLKRNPNKAFQVPLKSHWPSFSKMMPNETIHNNGEAMYQYHITRPPLFVFWAPDLFWPK